MKKLKTVKSKDRQGDGDAGSFHCGTNCPFKKAEHQQEAVGRREERSCRVIVRNIYKLYKYQSLASPGAAFKGVCWCKDAAAHQENVIDGRNNRAAVALKPRLGSFGDGDGRRHRFGVVSLMEVHL